jgi:acetolactate synthase-1/2/3 large subunit
VGVDGQFQHQTPPGDLIQIDIEGPMIGRTHTAKFPIQGDALAAITALSEQLVDAEVNDDQFNQTIWEARDGLRGAMRKRLGRDFPQIMDIIRSQLPETGLFVRDQTISAYNWGNQQFPILRPRTSLNPSSGAIGPGFPLALGAAVGTGEKTVVVHGDGGFMFHATELATAAQYQIPLVILVFNDSGYGVLRWLQETRFGRINETDLGKVAFATMAESMGVPGQRVKTVADFEAALTLAMQGSGPYLIDVDMASFDPMEISIMPKRNHEVDSGLRKS